MSLRDHNFVGDAVAHVQSNVIPATVATLQGPVCHIGNHFRDVGPALSFNVAYQVQANITPAIRNTVIRAGEAIQNIGPAIKDAIQAAIIQFQKNLGDKFEKAPQILLQSVEEAGSWVKENPGKTALLIVSALALVAPVIIVGPALAGLGFGAEGVAVGRLYVSHLNSRHTDLFHRLCCSWYSGWHWQYCG